MTYSALWFSQIQFFGSLSFMAVFFALSLGLSWILLYLRLMTMGGRHLLWLPIYRFWVRIFALASLLSFASSMPVLIQLGSLWPHLLPKIQAVSSPLLTVVLLSALVFKAAFFGFMLFRQRQLPDWLHAIIIFLVALGNTVIALCLLLLVSWVQTPTGTEWIEGSYVVQSWSALMMNPSWLWYVALFVAASFVLTSMTMIAILALQSLYRPAAEGERRVFELSVYVGSLAWVLLLVAFIAHSEMIKIHQPAKAAAAMGQVLIAGMSPPLHWVYWSLRLAMLSGFGVFIVLLQGWYLGLWRHHDLSVLSPLNRKLIMLSGFFGPLLLISGMSYQLFGGLPFVVGQTVTISEVYAQLSLSQSVVGLLLYGVVYLLFLFGFMVIVRHTTRYGVVAVARHRGRA